MKQNEVSPVEAVCYGKSDHATLLGVVAAGNQCLKSDIAMAPKEEEWYLNRYLWLSIGLVVGGAAVGYAVTR